MLNNMSRAKCLLLLPLHLNNSIFSVTEKGE
jgi:hypothetical protein